MMPWNPKARIARTRPSYVPNLWSLQWQLFSSAAPGGSAQPWADRKRDAQAGPGPGPGREERNSHQPASSPRERALAVIAAIDGKRLVLTIGYLRAKRGRKRSNQHDIGQF